MSMDALLAARAHAEGKAQPTALLRHRHIAKDAICIVAWQLGQEPYSVGGIAIGTETGGYDIYVPGYPLDRQLLFAALTPFAKKFCDLFEKWAQGPCEIVQHFGAELRVPRAMPQIVVANAETIALLGRLGRRLAYLPTTGEHPADPALPRLGRHLMWLAEHAKFPGQQLMLSMTDLLAEHYATAMSAYETNSLAALEAWINPPAGMHGFHAAERAERQAVGPTPDPEDGETIFKAMKAFNAARAGSRDPAVVRKHLGPLRRMYDGMVSDTWKLVWKTVDRERRRAEAPSVQRRVREDRIAYASHIAWMNGPAEGRRKTRKTPRLAAMQLNAWERAQVLLAAEEAIDDPLRMAPVLLSGKAVAGEVVRVDTNRREVVNTRNCLRPSVTLRSVEPCSLPVGAALWWTKAAAEREWIVAEVVPAGAGAEVTLVLQTNRALAAGLPRRGQRACFSEMNVRDPYEVHLPQRAPWTHRTPDVVETDLEAGAEAA